MRDLMKSMAELRNRYLLLVDLVIFAVTPICAFFLRTESLSELVPFAGPMLFFILAVSAGKFFSFLGTGLYSRYWPYASAPELLTLARALLVAVFVEGFISYAVLFPLGILPLGFPMSIPMLDALLTVISVSMVRLSIRLVIALSVSDEKRDQQKEAIIVGAGAAGAMVASELLTNRDSDFRPVGYVDDDPRKQNKWVSGVQVLGTLDDLPWLLADREIGQVIIAIPTAPGKIVRKVVAACKAASVESKTIPGLFEILSGNARVDQVRNVQLEDLLRRGAVHMDTQRVISSLRNSCVMVTGAGGSIGSELCRQIREFQPSDLILLGHGENSIFLIAQELREHVRPGVKIHPVIADIRDRERMKQVFALHRPNAVFHAAAHKHLPLMEANVADAITNNVMGTKTLLDLAERYGAERFVMISTDKAVNPTSILGVTKRIAELLVTETAQRSGCRYTTVRFGNVLGSRGSVVPVFKRQIELGGPITVTHPEVRRYFMTIPEAVQLVLQAGAMAQGGEVFVLDMGEQIRIVDLARDLIRLNGLQEGRDIEITYTGLRPGEKMNEELFFGGDKIEQTSHGKIMVCRNVGVPWTLNDVTRIPGRLFGEDTTGGSENRSLGLVVDTLADAAQQGELRGAWRIMKELVPEYQGSLLESEPPDPLGNMLPFEPDVRREPKVTRTDA